MNACCHTRIVDQHVHTIFRQPEQLLEEKQHTGRKNRFMSGFLSGQD